MRLIDADKLKAHYSWWNEERREVFDTIVDMQPTIDAVPVVRCKDCKHGYLWTNDGTGARGKCVFMVGNNQYVHAEEFCNLGKRKGGDE